MSTFPLSTGEILPLTRSVRISADPFDVYARLTHDARQDTCFVDFEGGAVAACVRAAARIESRAGRVVATALTENGRDAVAHLAAQFRALGQVRVEGASVTLELEEQAACARERDRLKAPSVVDALRAAMRFELSVRPSRRTILFPGFFAYDLLERFESLPDTEPGDELSARDFVFLLPQEQVLFEPEHGVARVSCFVYGGATAEGARHDASSAVARLTRDCEQSPPGEQGGAPSRARAHHAPLEEVACDVSDGEFAEQVRRAKTHILDGDVFQLVLSREFRAPCVDPVRAFQRLRELNPSPFTFFFATSAGTVFGASPETSVRVDAAPRRVHIRPIAGTRRRARRPDGSIDRDLDARLEAELRLDPKELAEHMMLVDLARNDVARVARPGTRHVSRLMGVDRYQAVMHLVSHVEGELREDLDALHAYVASMNMGTLTGAPKIRAAQLIRRYERTRRGPYGGAIGFLTPEGELDTAIIIRSAVVRDGVARVRAGAGIVIDSDPESEAEETRKKAEAVLRALSQATRDTEVA